MSAANGIQVGGLGTVNLDGGTITTKMIIGPAAAGGILDFNGGTLKPVQNRGSFLSGLAIADVKPGGAIVDTAGFDISIAPSLVHETAAGDPPLDGGLLKKGAGTLTLLGDNTYTGGTTVSAGTLAAK